MKFARSATIVSRLFDHSVSEPSCAKGNPACEKAPQLILVSAFSLVSRSLTRAADRTLFLAFGESPLLEPHIHHG